jgi:hypothetical protein
MRGSLRKFRKILRNLIRDLRFGGLLGRTIRTRYAHLGAVSTVSTDYAVLPEIFGGVIGPDDTLVDVGCGRGRVIAWWLGEGYKNRIIGVELDSEVANYTRRLTRRFPNVSIVTGNIIDCIPQNGTIFYLYNPFSREVTEKLASRMKEIFATKSFLLIYYNCVHVEIFTKDPWWFTTEKQLGAINSVSDRVAYIMPRSTRRFVTSVSPGEA